MLMAMQGNIMFLSNDVLIGLLAERRELYEQLGLIDKYVADAQDSPAFGTSVGNAVMMSEPIEGLEEQIADINRRIARIRGPIPDVLAFDLN
jgi:hypothetical protein